MVNLKTELINYPPIDLAILEAKEPGMPDNIVNSILLYNKALEKLRMGSEDIAIIELKKAVSLNPNFYEAMNLLGLCYLYTKDYAKAQEAFSKVMSQERNGVKALNYINMMNSGAFSQQTQDNAKSFAAPSVRKQLKEKEKKSAGNAVEQLKSASKPKAIMKKDFIRIIAGFAAGIVLMMLLNLIIKPSADDSSIAGYKQNAYAAAEQNTKITELSEKVDKLSAENEKLQNDIKAASSELDYYKNVSRLFEAEKLFSEGSLEGAADILVLIKSVGFRDPEKSKFEALFNNIIPKAAWRVFNEGNDLMGRKKYQDAVGKLSKIQVYGKDWAYLDITLYNIGLCYKEMNDSKNALEAFNKLIKDYPSSQYAEYARYRINELQGQP
ncbi:MAG: tetratricopeptide repeat protein [Clostridia bacterium]|nr:tetratricopeptide repeat protein [Clostridia bacterium]